MKRLLLLSAVCIALATPAFAEQRAAEVPEYRGVLYLSAVNAACIEAGYAMGNNFEMAVRLKPRPGNNRGGGLLLGSGLIGYNYNLPDGKTLATGSSTFTGTGFSSHVGAYGWTSKYKLTITVTGTTAIISGTVNDFNSEPGCTATVQGAGTLRLYNP